MIKSVPCVYILFDLFISKGTGHASTKTLIHLMKGLGFTETAVRLTLARMSDNGFVAGVKKGRETVWELTERGNTILQRSSDWVGFESDEKWDGKWYLVTYSIPEEKRVLRDTLRQELVNLGFGNLSHSLWLIPHNLKSRVDVLKNRLKETGVEEVFGYIEEFVAQHLGKPEVLVRKSWNLGERNQAYGEYIAAYAKYEKSAGKERLADDEAFRVFISAINDYVNIEFEDPLLPKDILPKNWKGFEANRLEKELVKILEKQAVKYFREIVDLYS